jgi:hypothetical protein
MIVEETVEILLELHLKVMAQAPRETMVLPGAEALHPSVVVQMWPLQKLRSRKKSMTRTVTLRHWHLAEESNLDMPTSSPTS